MLSIASLPTHFVPTVLIPSTLSIVSMKSTVLTAAVAFVLILTGCAGEAPVKTTINTVDPHDTLNPVHNRDDSVELYNTTRAGASLRQNEAAHVLWNEHYAADADELKAREAALAAAAEKERLEKEKAAKERAEKAKAAASGKNAQSAKNGKNARGAKNNARDKSIYGKDRSVYAKDKSVYAEKNSAK